jgi:indole-3-glycerol phosphate synthase
VTSTILDRILQRKRHEIAAAKADCSERELVSRLPSAPPPRDFVDALRTGDRIHLIAEVKKASPSRGILRADFNPVAIAHIYETHGADCLSILTDESFFQGSLHYLRSVREAVKLPLLRKDFILETYQLLEARLAGADAVLLIAECLDDCQLRKLVQETCELGMVPLVEFYEAENCDRVVDAGATLVGVNNRDLRTFEVDLEHTVRMMAQIPGNCVVVGESGIRGRADTLRLQEAGVHAMLVGEHLVTQEDIGRAVRELLGH